MELLAAIVVTYYPEAQVTDNLVLLKAEFPIVLVIDNASDEATRRGLRDFCNASGIFFLENEKNMGIAAALNQGVQFAAEKQCTHVFFFDQDSRITPRYSTEMLKAYTGGSIRLGLLIPKYYDERVRSAIPPKVIHGKIQLAITSGSMASIALLMRAGPFRECFFIDYVDYEFSLRVRALGYEIAECAGATLYHAPANPSSYRFLGMNILSAGYSANRRFYIERNMVWMMKLFSARYPRLCLWMLSNSLKDVLKIILVEPSKCSKLRESLRGVLAGITSSCERDAIS